MTVLDIALVTLCVVILAPVLFRGLALILWLAGGVYTIWRNQNLWD